MSKRGRPRKPNVGRDGAGRIKASVYRTLKQRARVEHRTDQNEIAMWQRMRVMARSNALDPRLGSLLGRMYLIGQPERIDERMLTAGLRLAQILFVYDVRILNLYRGVKAQDIAAQKGLVLADERPDLIKDAANAYATLLTVLGERTFTGSDGAQLTRHRPGKIAEATFAVCRDAGDEAHRTPEEIGLAVEGLKRIARYWGLYDDEGERIRRWRDRETLAARAARIMAPSGEAPDED